MELTIRILPHETFKVVIDPSSTIRQLKEQIETERSYPCDLQRLIYAGKILTDDGLISQLNLNEHKFLILMVSKLKTPSGDKPETTEEPTKTQEPAQLSGEAFETAVRSIMEMGYRREDIEEAMHASSNNPDQAVEHLQSLLLQPSTESDSRRLTLIEHVREMARANPELFDALVHNMSGAQPDFENLMTSDDGRQFMSLVQGLNTSGNGDLENDHEEEEVVPLLPHDREAIHRLMDLGFSEGLAIQAYLACDKNENLAANLLLSNDLEE